MSTIQIRLQKVAKCLALNDFSQTNSNNTHVSFIRENTVVLTWVIFGVKRYLLFSFKDCLVRDKTWLKWEKILTIFLKKKNRLYQIHRADLQTISIFTTSFLVYFSSNFLYFFFFEWNDLHIAQRWHIFIALCFVRLKTNLCLVWKFIANCWWDAIYLMVFLVDF